MAERLGETSVFLPMRVGPAAPSGLLDAVKWVFGRPGLEITLEGISLKNAPHDDFNIAWLDIDAIEMDLSAMASNTDPKQIPVQIIAYNGSKRTLPTNLEMIPLALFPILEVCFQKLTGRSSRANPAG